MTSIDPAPARVDSTRTGDVVRELPASEDGSRPALRVVCLDDGLGTPAQARAQYRTARALREAEQLIERDEGDLERLAELGAGPDALGRIERNLAHRRARVLALRAELEDLRRAAASRSAARAVEEARRATRRRYELPTVVQARERRARPTSGAAPPAESDDPEPPPPDTPARLVDGGAT